jgi:hypothetical protein
VDTIVVGVVITKKTIFIIAVEEGDNDMAT